MKPGDLIMLCSESPRTVYTYSAEDIEWEPGRMGIFLGGRDAGLGMLEVLYDGRMGWLDEDTCVSVVDDPA